MISFLLALLTVGFASAAEAPRGQEIYTETQSYLFNDRVHALVIKTRRQTHETLLELGRKKTFKDFGRALSVCFYQEDDAPKTAQLAECVENVAYRVRGNRSRRRDKRQFKVQFNANRGLFENRLEPWHFPPDSGVKKRRFHGLKSVSLRSAGPSSNDPTFVREPLASRIFATVMAPAGGPPPVYRVSYTRLYVQYCELRRNREICAAPRDKGLYFLTDEIDESFLESYLGYEPDGALFQAGYGAGDKKANFLFSNFAAPAYDSKDFQLTLTDLARFRVGRLGHEWGECEQKFVERPDVYLPSGSISKIAGREEILPYLFMCASVRSIEVMTAREIAEHFDVDQLLRYLVAVNFSGHWDSLMGNSNNEYLYFDPRVSKWRVFVWDLDLTFGAQDGYQQEAGAFQFRQITTNRLFETLLGLPAFRARYLEIYREALPRLTPEALGLSGLQATVDHAVTGTEEDDADYQAARLTDATRVFINARRRAVSRDLFP